MEKLLLIDGNSLFNRAYYATPTTFLTKSGTPTNAIYGFTTMLFKAITDFKPTHIAVAFDLKAPTFRHKIYTDYKGTRKPMPEDLRVQVPLIKKMLKAMNIAIFELEGYEADDIIGTIAKNNKIDKVIITGDNDYLQLIDNTTTVYITKKGITDLAEMTEETLMKVRGLTPSQIIDLKSLMGDSSDNIKGVLGVGEKTATTLVQKYNNLDGVYSNIDDIKGSLKEKLVSHKDDAYLSKTLATINCNTPIGFDINKIQLKVPFSNEVLQIFNEFEFKSLTKRTEFFENSDREIKICHDFKLVVIEDIAQLKSILKENESASELSFEFNELIYFSFDCITTYKVAPYNLLMGVSIESALNELKPYLEGNIIKTVYDVKRLRKILDAYNISLNNAQYDVMLMQYIVSFLPSVNNAISLLNYYEYNCDCITSGLFSIKNELVTKLQDEKLYKLYFDIELPLSNVLYNMEKVGFNVDKNVLNELKTKYDNELSELTEKIHNLAGEKFNINSPKQLGDILFGKLNLAKGKKTKSGLSTSADVLEKIVDTHEIVPCVLRYRQIQKLSASYIEGMGSQIESDGKIHTIFNQALTVTGRLSSKEPNLQTIPIRTNEGRMLRKLFVPSEEGNKLVSADYSQIELRLLAHFSEDEVLIKCYNEGVDIHKTTAASVFNVPIEKITNEMRSASKAVNFGIIYGISDFGLANQIGVTTRVAKDYINKYFEKYPKVHNYMLGNVAFCKQHGYVETLTGRRRIIREINSANHFQRAFGERAAMNMPLQGSAADIIKIAMINVNNRLMWEKLHSKLILQVHDELIIDTKSNELDKVIIILKEEMEKAVSLKVPLTVNISYGDNLYEAK